MHLRNPALAALVSEARHERGAAGTGAGTGAGAGPGAGTAGAGLGLGPGGIDWNSPPSTPARQLSGGLDEASSPTLTRTTPHFSPNPNPSPSPHPLTFHPNPDPNPNQASMNSPGLASISRGVTAEGVGSLQASRVQHYAVAHFRDIRASFNISADFADAFTRSVPDQLDTWRPLRESVSEGASGSFFYWVKLRDGTDTGYIVKQVLRVYF